MSWHANVFRITDFLWGNFTIGLSDAEPWCFLWLAYESFKTINWFAGDLRHPYGHVVSLFHPSGCPRNWSNKIPWLFLDHETKFLVSNTQKLSLLSLNSFPLALTTLHSTPFYSVYEIHDGQKCVTVFFEKISAKSSKKDNMAGWNYLFK